MAFWNPIDYGTELIKEGASRITGNEYDMRDPRSQFYGEEKSVQVPGRAITPSEAAMMSGPSNVGANNPSQDTRDKQAVLGVGTGRSTSGSGGGAAPDYDPEDLAYLDETEGSLKRQLGRTDSALAQALDALLQNYNKELSGANKTQGRNLEDFETKTQISEMGRGRELGKVDTRARMLADSLRQRLGLAGGSGSSAYQYAAPRAVQRQASSERGDVLSDYSANFQALDTNKRRGEEDYQELLRELKSQRTQREGGVRGDIEESRNEIRENLGRVAGERAKLKGGGYDGVRSAMAPYQSQIQGGESLIDSIYSKYAAKYKVNPLQARTTNLRDYATDRTAVRDNAAGGQQNQYAPYKPYLEDEEAVL